MSSDFLFTVEDGLATITFNRPEKANAFHPRSFAAMTRAFIDIQHNPDVRCVLIRGEGKHFMAGGDLETVVVFDKATESERTDFGEEPIYAYNRLVRTMQRLDKPVVASVQGGVAGAGVGFIGACDLVIAADTSFFWAAHILHGASNDGLLSYFLPRHIGLRRTLELALLGDRISGVDAHRIGLVNLVVPEADLAAETDKLVGRLRNGPTQGYGLIKKLIYASFDNSMSEQGRLEAESYAQALHTADVRDGLRAFFERRSPNFQGR